MLNQSLSKQIFLICVIHGMLNILTVLVSVARLLISFAIYDLCIAHALNMTPQEDRAELFLAYMQIAAIK